MYENVFAPQPNTDTKTMQILMCCTVTTNVHINIHFDFFPPHLRFGMVTETQNGREPALSCSLEPQTNATTVRSKITQAHCGVVMVTMILREKNMKRTQDKSRFSPIRAGHDDYYGFTTALCPPLSHLI
jgi:hypothetical protein